METHEEMNSLELEIRNLNNDISELIKKIFLTGDFKFRLLIYRLLKSGKVGVQDITQCLEGVNRRSVYHIYEKMDSYFREKTKQP